MRISNGTGLVVPYCMGGCSCVCDGGCLSSHTCPSAQRLLWTAPGCCICSSSSLILVFLGCQLSLAPRLQGFPSNTERWTLWLLALHQHLTGNSSPIRASIWSRNLTCMQFLGSSSPMRTSIRSRHFTCMSKLTRQVCLLYWFSSTLSP